MTKDFQDMSVISLPFCKVWIPLTWNCRETLNHWRMVPFVGGDDDKPRLRLETLAPELSARRESCTIAETAEAFWPTKNPLNCGSSKLWSRNVRFWLTWRAIDTEARPFEREAERAGESVTLAALRSPGGEDRTIANSMVSRKNVRIRILRALVVHSLGGGRCS